MGATEDAAAAPLCSRRGARYFWGGALKLARQPRTYVRPVEVAVPYVLVAAALVAGALTSPGFLSSNHLSSMAPDCGVHRDHRDRRRRWCS